MTLPITLLTTFLMYSCMLYSQHYLPDSICGTPLMPVWRKVLVPEGTNYLERTYYLWPADSSSRNPAERIYRGIGRAYYDHNGDLLWVEEGYGVKKRSCALNAKAIASNGSIQTRDSIHRSKVLFYMKATSTGTTSPVLFLSPGGGEYRIEWIDRKLEVCGKNPCR